MRKKSYPVSMVTWWIALVLIVLAIISNFGILRIPVISGFSFWMAVISSGLLLIATRIKAL